MSPALTQPVEDCRCRTDGIPLGEVPGVRAGAAQGPAPVQHEPTVLDSCSSRLHPVTLRGSRMRSKDETIGRIKALGAKLPKARGCADERVKGGYGAIDAASEPNDIHGSRICLGPPPPGCVASPGPARMAHCPGSRRPASGARGETMRKKLILLGTFLSSAGVLAFGQTSQVDSSDKPLRVSEG
jgi:hypothetical protein